MKAALRQAHKAALLDEVPVGAVIVRDGRILSRGHNLRESKASVLGHAELVALAKATKALGTWRLVGCDVYVTLEPCPMCAAALQQARVRQVYYGVRDPKGGAQSLGFNLNQHEKLNHRYGLNCLELPECGRVLSDFFKAKRGRKKN